MKKQASSLPLKPQAAPLQETTGFGRVFVLKKDKLETAVDLPENAKPIVKPFKTEQEFVNLIYGNRAVLFGEKTMGWKMEPTANSSFRWIKLLFDFTNPDSPRCYILAVILGKEKDFFEEFFPFMTRVFSLLRDVINIGMLVKLIGDGIKRNKSSLKAFEKHLQGKTLDDLLAHTLLKTPKCLLITEDPLTELSTVKKAYAETWGGMLDIIYIRKYLVGKATMLSMHPTLADFQRKPKELGPPKEKVIHTEDHHFSKGPLIGRTIYERLKSEALKIDKSIVFNAKGKHYISLKKGSGKNLAFFHFRKGGMYLVVMLEEKLVRKLVKHSEIKTLPESVQKFWNGKSTGLVISSMQHVKEIVEVFKKLIKQ